jgi:PBSX family phage terminase large subunit
MAEKIVTIKALQKQAEFISMVQKFRAFVAGYGAGKTTAGGLVLCVHFYKFPGINAGYFAPSYIQIRDIFYPAIDEIAYNCGLSADIKIGNHEVHLSSGKGYRGTIICRSLDHPESIVGFKIGHAVVDELDIMPQAKADMAWNKIIARMRYNIPGLKNGVDVTTTPEGFKFTYKKFVKEASESYGIIHSSTYDNEINLPHDYIPSLIETYPANVIDAYLNGQFVNLTSGKIYVYDRALHRSTETIEPGDTLHIGQDFNVGKMASCVCIRSDGGVYHAVDQLVRVFDTLELIRLIKDRYTGHKIIVYPDASGNSRKTTDASTSDIELLRQAGFVVKSNWINPPVRDRILSVNKAFENKRFLVNDIRCPDVAESLERQVYGENGEPDKSSGYDHMCEAAGYLVHYEIPIKSMYGTASRISF